MLLVETSSADRYRPSIVQLHSRPVVVASLPVLELEGDIDLATLPEFHQATSRFVGHHLGMVVAVDLDGVGTLADAGLGVLLGAAAQARSGLGDVVLVCAGERLRERLAVSRLDRAVDVYATTTEAARQRTNGPVDQPLQQPFPEHG